jgi:Domain of unknown function (DUF4333)
LLAGCHVNASSNAAPTVPKRQLEDTTADQIQHNTGKRPQVACPTDIPAKAGATADCVATAWNGQRFKLTITITKMTSPSDGEFHYHIGAQLPAAG